MIVRLKSHVLKTGLKVGVSSLIVVLSACSSKKSVDKFTFPQADIPVASPSPEPSPSPTPQPSPSPSPSPVDGCLNDAFGDFKDFNIIARDRAVVRKSVLQKRIGAVSKAKAASSDVGMSLPTDVDRADIASNRRTVVRRSKVPHGKVTYVSSEGVSNSTILGGVHKEKAVDLDRAFLLVQFLSTASTVPAANGTWKRDCPTGIFPIKKCTATLSGTSADLNVFNIDSSVLRGAKTVHLDVPPGSSTIVNIKGPNLVWWNNKNFTVAPGVEPEKILWNWKTDGRLVMSKVELVGHLIAPKAKVNLLSSRVWGGVMATTVTARESRLEATTFNGCVPEVKDGK